MKTTSPTLTLCPFTVVVDTAEQAPYRFDNMPTTGRSKGGRMIVHTNHRALITGDYSIEGFEGRVAVERKSLGDLYGTIGKHVRQRGKVDGAGDLTTFEKELARLNSLQRAAVIIEADWREICRPAESVSYEEKAFDAIREGLRQSGAMESSDSQGVTAALAVLLGRLQTRWREFPAARTWQSKMNPRSVWGCIFAWQERFPRIHWLAMGSRRLGELATFEVLERFWREKEG